MEHSDPTGLDVLWTEMDNEKGDLRTRSENYARLTIPYICPADNSGNTEQDRAYVAIGPRLVNHLANKVVDTMFPQDRPFFTIALTSEARRAMQADIGEENEAAFYEAVRKATASVEQAAMRKMQLVSYRPQAVETVKHMIITGNVCLRRLPEGKRVVYGIKDFSVRRSIDGAPIEVLLRDAKNVGSLAPDQKKKYLAVNPQARDKDQCVLYTHYKLNGKRWDMRQAVDRVGIVDGVSYVPKDLPVLPLTWTIARGENYGRGLVEDEITNFHNIDVATEALLDMIGILADVKYLVDPASMLDVAELNNSKRGSYHLGRKDDISSPEMKRALEVQALAASIDKWEMELAKSFLLNSSATRDAERVTAEEIRFIARELESAFGGLYSRLAMEWQQHEAEYTVSKIDFKEVQGNLKLFEVVITTGLESLSREGQLANLRMAINDLAMLEGIPESVQGTINPLKFASFVFTNHTVNLSEFMYSKEEMEANNAAAMEREKQIANVQADANVRQEAGKAAVNQEK